MRGDAGWPARIAWAVETMEVRPGDHVLEIGPGTGVAVAAVVERLAEGTITAIDRSAKAIAATRARNAAAVAAGRVVLETTPLERADLRAGMFERIFAINVNLFWVRDAGAVLASLRRALAREGVLYLFYEPPGPEQARRISRIVGQAVGAAGFTATAVEAERGGRPLVAIVGRPGT